MSPSNAVPAHSRPVPPEKRGISLGRVAIVGALAHVLLSVSGFIIQMFSSWTGFGPWFLVAVGALAVALVEVIRELALGAAGSRRAEQFRTPASIGVPIAILLVSALGLAAAYGVGMASAYITGNQSGTKRLATVVVAEEQGITTTIRSVVHTRNFTRVGISVVNDLPSTVSLPLYRNATLSTRGVPTLGADPFRSSWSDTIAPGQEVTGVLVFPGHLPDGRTRATLSFATVFEQGFEGPDSIVVGGIVLDPVG
jgi:hypothetical protein